MISDMYTSNPEFRTCASSGIWMEVDSLQDLGPEEQIKQQIVFLCIPHCTTTKKRKKREHKCNTEKLPKIQADKNNRKKY